jgi:uncharacterized membrane protein HdeD (DUF308 family)
MRSMYWYALTPVVVIFGGLVFLTMPYLALAALAIVAFLAVRGLVRAIALAVSHRWHMRTSGRHELHRS